MRKLSLNLVISAISVISIFLLLELFARFLNPILRISHGHISLGIGGQDILEYPSGYIKDRELFWRLDPASEEYNSAGFRDKELPLHKGNNVFRIICMGDSVTFGWPTKLENTYPKTLEKLLNLHFSQRKFEVFNAGVPGYTSYQGLVWLKKELINYNPDLIIVYYGVNDRGGSYKTDREQIKLLEWMVRIANYLRKFQFYNLCQKIVLHIKHHPGLKNKYTKHRVPPEEFKMNLYSMAKLVNHNGFKILFLVRPVFYDPEEKVVFTDNRYIAPEDIPQFDIYNVFRKRQDQAHKLFLDDARPYNFHLTDKGHLILAEEIFKILVNRL